MLTDELRSVRKSQGITLKELAESSKTSYSRISAIESGKDNPSLDVLQRIATALGCRLTLIKDSE